VHVITVDLKFRTTNYFDVVEGESYFLCINKFKLNPQKQEVTNSEA
jgi:hypothetical protein